MARRTLMIASILTAFACGVAANTLVEPGAAQANEGRFTECFVIVEVADALARDMSPDYSPSRVTRIPNGWTVAGAAGSANGFGANVVVCR